MFRIRQAASHISSLPSSVGTSWAQVRNATVKHGRPPGRAKGTTKHWSEEKLKIQSDYPLTSVLSEVIRPELGRGMKPKKVRGTSSIGEQRGSSVHVRTQIVSPRLCDDVINYIGHTLEKHKGCDILDINPGAGLWSQSLHNFLKPRSHILLEPRYEKFKTFLDPLLSAPDSKYMLVEKDPCELSSYKDMVDEGLFPYQQRLSTENSGTQRINDTLLVIGSLAWDPILPGHGFDSMAKQLFHHFASAAWSNDIFHTFGSVRTLFWVQHDDFNSMVAQSVTGMQKANAGLEMTLDMNVVVSAEHGERKFGKGSIGREPQYELESTIRALQRGKEKGMELPHHRRDPVHECAEDIEKLSGRTGRTRSDVVHDYLYRRQLDGKLITGLLAKGFMDVYNTERTLREAYPDVNFDIEKPTRGKQRAPRISTKLKDHPAYEEIAAFYKGRTATQHLMKMKQRVERVADIGEDMHRLECQVLMMEDGPEKELLMKEIEGMETDWQRHLDAIPANYLSAPLSETDDRLAIRTPPYPRLQWDRRPFEPLVMRSDEVWPQNRLTLVSSEPIPRPAAQSSDWYEWVQDFVFGLYSEPAKSVGHALDTMQHGLSDIMKDCPSLKDPKKGGRLNLNQLRVRVLTSDMIEELVTAYRNWPFKAPGSDHNKYFRHKSTSQGYSPRP